MIKTIPEQNAPQVNPLFESAHDKKQRLDYIEATKKQNAVLKLEAEKFEYMYKALSFKMGLNQLRAQLLAEEAAANTQAPTEGIAQGPWETPTPDQEVPTSPYDAEATTSGADHDIDSVPIQESRPIMEVHHRDALAD